jgi:iron(II)-dependent oxidoreductase
MRTSNRNVILGSTALLAALDMALGWAVWWRPPVFVAGAVGLVYVLHRAAQARLSTPGAKPLASSQSPEEEVPAWAPAVARKPAPNDPVGLIETMLAQGRYALLLRPQIARTLGEDQFHRALHALSEGTALVPEGEVIMGPMDQRPEDGAPESDELAARAPRVVRVEPLFLDRYPVTNRQFYEFVAAGGYNDPALWDGAMLPAVLDFVDQTGQPGPRLWKGGCYDPAKEDHAVVGVSWCEATAYSRWVGKRLPTDAEWVKAGSWPVSLAVGSRSQRRYPWGDAMDRTRANLWGSGPKGTVPVTAFAGGVSVGGVYQLIGNVWEWMRGSYPPPDATEAGWIFETPLKSIRGGAFDTYFDTQATCQFQSGETAIARKHNIGFRCAVGVCDLLLARSAEDGAAAASIQVYLPEEVPA